MTREEARVKRFREGVLSMSTNERDALQTAMLTAREIPGGKGMSIVNQLVDMAIARARTGRKRDSDAQTDRKRRQLVGARLPRHQAERCRACARLEGESVYRFVCSALERACSEVEARHRQQGGPATGF
ncbi:MAG TPA: hypothetical protein H9839_02400 [Candidatus Intestinimonas stercorigallinarum]|nr:hypothetical protein [Candidatus Intestinimonas stercorigallinarum]